MLRCTLCQTGRPDKLLSVLGWLDTVLSRTSQPEAQVEWQDRLCWTQQAQASLTAGLELIVAL